MRFFSPFTVRYYCRSTVPSVFMGGDCPRFKFVRSRLRRGIYIHVCAHAKAQYPDFYVETGPTPPAASATLILHCSSTGRIRTAIKRTRPSRHSRTLSMHSTWIAIRLLSAQPRRARLGRLLPVVHHVQRSQSRFSVADIQLLHFNDGFLFNPRGFGARLWLDKFLSACGSEITDR